MGGEEIGNTHPQLSISVCVCNIHSPEPQTCLGEPGKAFLITIVFAKVIKCKEKKNKKEKKYSKKEKKKKPTKKNTESSPWPLLQTPKRGGGSVCLGFPGSCRADLWAQSLAFVPSIAVWRGVGKLWVWPRGQGD